MLPVVREGFTPRGNAPSKCSLPARFCLPALILGSPATLGIDSSDAAEAAQAVAVGLTDALDVLEIWQPSDRV
jgi:hypothetical protein